MIVIPTLYNKDISKQSLTITKENTRQEMTRDFFTEVHLLPGKLILVVAIHPLDGSRANWQFKVKHSAGAAHPLTR